MLTGRQITAALLVAEDRFTDRKIAKVVGVDHRTICNWRQEPEFAGEVARHRDAWRAIVFSRGIAQKEYRVNLCQNLLKRCEAIILARAEQGKRGGPLEHLPGYATGVMLRRERALPIGDKQFSTVEEVEVDTGLMTEMRAIMAHAATELGQLKTKVEVTGNNGGPIQVTDTALQALTDTELDALIRISEKLHHRGSESGAAPPPAKQDSELFSGDGAVSPGVVPEAR